MLIKQISVGDDGQNDGEQVITIVQNVDGSGSFTLGNAVNLVNSGASIDGFQAVKVGTATGTLFMGVANQNIPINGYGQVVAWGYAQAATLSNVGTSITITAGNTLIPGAVSGTFFSSVTNQAMSTLFYRYVVATSTVTVSAATTVPVIVRAL